MVSIVWRLQCSVESRVALDKSLTTHPPRRNARVTTHLNNSGTRGQAQPSGPSRETRLKQANSREGGKKSFIRWLGFKTPPTLPFHPAPVKARFQSLSLSYIYISFPAGNRGRRIKKNLDCFFFFPIGF